MAITLKNDSLCKDVERVEPLCTVSGNENDVSAMNTV
jgi:hypothetical protein